MVADRLTTDDPRQPVQIGPRLRAELERRVRELEAHFRPTPRDMRELAHLRNSCELRRSRGAMTQRDGRGHTLPLGRL